MAIPRDESGQQSDMTAFLGKGDYVVGQYSEFGRTERVGVAPVPESVVIASKIVASAKAAGGIELPTLKAKGKKGRKNQPMLTNHPVAPQSNTLLPPVSNPHPGIQIDVVFNTQLGKIKASTIGVLEGDTSLVLVYRSEQDISYEPNVGSTIQLVIDGKPVDVMYPGFKYAWLDGTTRLMVFTKIPKE